MRSGLLRLPQLPQQARPSTGAAPGTQASSGGQRVGQVGLVPAKRTQVRSPVREPGPPGSVLLGPGGKSVMRPPSSKDTLPRASIHKTSEGPGAVWGVAARAQHRPLVRGPRRGLIGQALHRRRSAATVKAVTPRPRWFRLQPSGQEGSEPPKPVCRLGWGWEEAPRQGHRAGRPRPRAARRHGTRGQVLRVRPAC